MKILKALILVSPFLLGACDGYELVRTEAFPYGNQRTAGTGVAYVLAKMAPPKQEIKPQVFLEQTKTVLEEIPEETFKDAQSK